MPHGIEAIKSHLQSVDNVPLLVSLFTDATSLSVRQMVEVFREHGEVVLTIGGGYRAHNHAIYSASDVATSVSVLPSLDSSNSNGGRSSGTSFLPSTEAALIDQFPIHSDNSLNRADVLLSFRLIGLTTINLLQMPYRNRNDYNSKVNNNLNNSDSNSTTTAATSTNSLCSGIWNYFTRASSSSIVGRCHRLASHEEDIHEHHPSCIELTCVTREEREEQQQHAQEDTREGACNSSNSRPDVTLQIQQQQYSTQHEPLIKQQYQTTAEGEEHLRLSVLLEAIHKGRILLRNMLQALGFYCIATVCDATMRYFIVIIIVMLLYYYCV